MTPPTLQLRRQLIKVAVAVTAALSAATLAAVVPSAGADQLSSDRAQAEQLATQIYNLGIREGALGEQYNQGVISLAQANERVAADNKKWAAAKAAQARAVALLRQTAINAYIGQGAQMQLAGATPLKNADDAFLRQELQQTATSDQNDMLDSYRYAVAQAAGAHTQLVKASDAKKTRLDALAHERAQVYAAELRVEGLESQVKGRIATIVAAIERQRELAAQRAEEALLARERAQQEAEARAEAAQEAAAQRQQEQRLAAERLAEQRQAAAAAQIDTGPPVTAATLPPVVPTTVPVATSGQNPNAAGAVAAAESRVGDPYVWGAAGPDAFDCSGLVMWSWAQVGVYLPHFSGAQYEDTLHISMADLEPGDLVFPADPGQHVAMYIGNGEIVQAPYTGANVQIVPLTGFFVLASRVG